jgi:hypothetical protein
MLVSFTREYHDLFSVVHASCMEDGVEGKVGTNVMNITILSKGFSLYFPKLHHQSGEFTAST